MKLNFCTLFDSNYLTRGLALYESLKQNSPSFHLYIFAFDNNCFKILKNMALENATIISLSDFEDEKLLSIKNTRTRVEYLWTCTPSIVLYTIKNFNIDICTYLDADLYFYDDPYCLIKELGSNSVLITQHNYYKLYDESEYSGIYCVQFLAFKSDENSLEVLNFWRDSCISWCHNSVDNGKYGDQKYLDLWPINFKGIKVSSNHGAGVAPWNLLRYEFTISDNKIFIKLKNDNLNTPLVFFHFHGLTFYKNETLKLTHHKYVIPEIVLHKIYVPYIEHLELLKEKIEKLDNSFDPNGSLEPFLKKDFGLKYLVKSYFSDIKWDLKKLLRSIFFVNIIEKIKFFKGLYNKDSLLNKIINK